MLSIPYERNRIHSPSRSLRRWSSELRKPLAFSGRDQIELKKRREEKRSEWNDQNPRIGFRSNYATEIVRRDWERNDSGGRRTLIIDGQFCSKPLRQEYDDTCERDGSYDPLRIHVCQSGVCMPSIFHVFYISQLAIATWPRMFKQNFKVKFIFST